jgi:hypothetical protein
MPRKPAPGTGFKPFRSSLLLVFLVFLACSTSGPKIGDLAPSGGPTDSTATPTGCHSSVSDFKLTFD